MVQKNNLVIMSRRSKSGNVIRFIGHSDKMVQFRNEVSFDMYNQYVDQGHDKPIDYPVDIEFKFFVDKVSEADLDNLSSIYLDAMQGVSAKHMKAVKLAAVLTDDKLVRRSTIEKVVKGDPKYDEPSRAEIRIRKYNF